MTLALERHSSPRLCEPSWIAVSSNNLSGRGLTAHVLALQGRRTERSSFLGDTATPRSGEPGSLQLQRFTLGEGVFAASNLGANQLLALIRPSTLAWPCCKTARVSHHDVRLVCVAGHPADIHRSHLEVIRRAVPIWTRIAFTSYCHERSHLSHAAAGVAPFFPSTVNCQNFRYFSIALVATTFCSNPSVA